MSSIDFPGFNDSHEGVTDTNILWEFTASLELKYAPNLPSITVPEWIFCRLNNDKKLSGIIYLHKIIDVRMEGVLVCNLRIFWKLCGNDALTNVVIMTTRWDDVQKKDRDTMVVWNTTLGHLGPLWGDSRLLESTKSEYLGCDPENQEASEWHTCSTCNHKLASAVGGCFMLPEYVLRGLSIELMVDKFYLTFLGCQSKAQEKAHWVWEIKWGMTFEGGWWFYQQWWILLES